MGAITDFLTRYPWVWVAISAVAAVIAFLAGQYWRKAEFGLKDREVKLQEAQLGLKDREFKLQEVRAQREIYERLQILQNQASEAIPRYLDLRDKRFPTEKTPAQTAEQLEKEREVQRAFAVEKEKLSGLIREYDQLEAKLATMEVRQPRWFVLPLPAMPPKNLTVERLPTGGNLLKWELPDPDPLTAAVKQDRRELFRQYGQEYRESPPQPPAEKK
jgi:hypothetical protein